jgi:hypothetical protein
MRCVLGIAIIFAGLVPATPITAAQNQPLKFEVASVKPSPPSTEFPLSFALCHGIDTQLPVLPAGAPITVPALGRCLIRRFTLSGMISFACPSTAPVLPADRVTGGPAWVASDGFDIEARRRTPLPLRTLNCSQCSSSYWQTALSFSSTQCPRSLMVTH